MKSESLFLCVVNRVRLMHARRTFAQTHRSPAVMVNQCKTYAFIGFSCCCFFTITCWWLNGRFRFATFDFDTYKYFAKSVRTRFGWNMYMISIFQMIFSDLMPLFIHYFPISHFPSNRNRNQVDKLFLLSQHLQLFLNRFRLHNDAMLLFTFRTFRWQWCGFSWMMKCLTEAIIRLHNWRKCLHARTYTTTLLYGNRPHSNPAANYTLPNNGM